MAHRATGSDLDIADSEKVRQFLDAHPEVTHIVNCAAEARVDLCEVERERAFRSNVLGPEVLAKEAAKRGLPFCHISTDYVFPGDESSPRKETDRTAPCNYYGETKLEGEKRVMRAHPAAWIIRTSWIFGGPLTREGRNLISRLLHWMQTQEEIRLTEDQWGRPTYVVDLANALLTFLRKSPSPGIYHFANRGVTNRYEFGNALRKELEERKMPLVVKAILPAPSTAFPSPCKRPGYSAFDTSKIEHILPIRSWQEALHDYVRGLL